MIFNTTCKAFRAEIRKKALSALGKLEETLSKEDFMSLVSCTFSYLQNGGICSSRLTASLCHGSRSSEVFTISRHSFHDCMYPLHKEKIRTGLTHTHTHFFGKVPQTYMRGCLQGYSPRFAPNKTSLTALTLCFLLIIDNFKKNDIAFSMNRHTLHTLTHLVLLLSPIKTWGI